MNALTMKFDAAFLSEGFTAEAAGCGEKKQFSL